ncbi:hypothetical protein [Dickeya sp. CFBP 2040]|uniref:hypothetical protein n=1 Tax=Dickeya sp. CFBP 2040 TaxID=2718531 RepID=UPI001445FEB3|nr:hypothetical protein [Dickeya sp. CFBP 2040]
MRDILSITGLSPEASRWLVTFVPNEFATHLPRDKARISLALKGPTRGVVQHADHLPGSTNI